MASVLFKHDLAKCYKRLYTKKCAYKSRDIINRITILRIDKYFRGICEFGDLECVKLAISRGATKLSSGLFTACSRGGPSPIPIIKYLICHGATRLSRCLSAAASIGDCEVVKTLLRAGARGHPNLFEAVAFGGSLQILQRILVYNVSDNYNMALFQACMYGRVDMVDFILDTCELNIEGVIEELDMSKMRPEIQELLTNYKPPMAYRFRCETSDSSSSAESDDGPAEGPLSDLFNNPNATDREQILMFLQTVMAQINQQTGRDSLEVTSD